MKRQSASPRMPEKELNVHSIWNDLVHRTPINSLDILGNSVADSNYHIGLYYCALILP